MVFQSRDMNTECNLHIGSLNVRGITDKVKRTSVFSWIRKNKFDITMLQETYSEVKNENIWKNEWEGDILFAHGSKHSRGVAVLFKQGLNYVIKKKHIDENGFSIIISIEIDDHIFNLVNVYVYMPNSQKDKKTFFSGLEFKFDTLNISTNSQNILGGDWNCIFDISVDKAGGRSSSNNIVTKK